MLFILLFTPLLLIAGQRHKAKNEMIIEGKTDSAYKVDLVIASKLMDLINKFSITRSITIKDGRFSFHIPGLQEPTNTRLIFYYPSGKMFVLENYLVEKEADKTKVVSWYHRRFIEVASQKYIDTLDNSKRDEIFTNVIDFFTEKWKNIPKPFKHRFLLFI